VLVAPAHHEEVTVEEATDESEAKTELRLVSPEVWRDETDEEFLGWIARKDIPASGDGSARPFLIVETTPDDRFFEAWEWNAGAVSVNTEKAKDLQRAKWERVAAGKIASLSQEYVSALLAQDSARQAEITAKVQALREVKNTALPDDLDGIAGTMPEILTS
jgi:hypothetical protein